MRFAWICLFISCLSFQPLLEGVHPRPVSAKAYFGSSNRGLIHRQPAAWPEEKERHCLGWEVREQKTRAFVEVGEGQIDEFRQFSPRNLTNSVRVGFGVSF